MKLKFQLQIMSLKGIAFDGMVESVYLTGDDGEYELLAFHHPLVGSIPEGDIHIADFGSVPINVGIISFKDNKCRVIAEIDPSFKNYVQLWDI